MTWLGQWKQIVSFGEDDTKARTHLLQDIHVRPGIGEDGGLNPVAFFAMAVAAEVDGGPCGLAGVHVGHDALWRKANETDK